MWKFHWDVFCKLPRTFELGLCRLLKRLESLYGLAETGKTEEWLLGNIFSNIWICKPAFLIPVCFRAVDNKDWMDSTKHVLMVLFKWKTAPHCVPNCEWKISCWFQDWNNTQFIDLKVKWTIIGKNFKRRLTQNNYALRQNSFHVPGLCENDMHEL